MFLGKLSSLCWRPIVGGITNSMFAPDVKALQFLVWLISVTIVKTFIMNATAKLTYLVVDSNDPFLICSNVLLSLISDILVYAWLTDQVEGMAQKCRTFLADAIDVHFFTSVLHNNYLLKFLVTKLHWSCCFVFHVVREIIVLCFTFSSLTFCVWKLKIAILTSSANKKVMQIERNERLSSTYNFLYIWET